MRLFRIRSTLMAAARQFRNPSVPLGLKVIVLLLALLIVSPLNILGDIPLLGLVDDVALLSLLAGWFVAAAARHAAETIDGAVVPVRPRRLALPTPHLPVVK
jgi:uncharacterized membrane protein YkvA (DUF1232 family)